MTTLRPILLGQCIYCQEQLDNLTEEHVVPFGLGGGRTLPAASCEACRRITHKFETKALRHVLGPGRYRLGIPARKKTKRPDFWPAYKHSDGGNDEKVLIPISELPFFLCMPTFATNTSIGGIIPPDHVPCIADGGVIICEDPVSLNRKLDAHGADYLSIDVDHLAFARMLAKIAVGYSVIEFGRSNFTPSVTPLILGKTDGYRNIVSSSHTSDPNYLGHAFPGLEPKHEHSLGHIVSDTTGMVCVRIDLFKNLDAPSYFILAGAVGGVTLRFGASQASPTTLHAV